MNFNKTKYIFDVRSILGENFGYGLALPEFAKSVAVMIVIGKITDTDVINRTKNILIRLETHDYLL